MTHACRSRSIAFVSKCFPTVNSDSSTMPEHLTYRRQQRDKDDTDDNQCQIVLHHWDIAEIIPRQG
jgi:hypothetical protein